MNTVEILELISTIPGWGTGEAIAQTERASDQAAIKGLFLKEDGRCSRCHEKMLAGEGFAWHQKGAVVNRTNGGAAARWTKAHASGICVAIKAEFYRLREQERAIEATFAVLADAFRDNPAAQEVVAKYEAELVQLRAKMTVIQTQFSTPLQGA